GEILVLQQELANFLFTSGLSFTWLTTLPSENGSTTFARAFEIPHRKETQTESHMTLVTDSWTNIRGEAIVNYVLVAPNGEAMFHSADPTGAESHTGSYLSKRIIEVIEDVGPEKIVAICSDTASNVQHAIKIVCRRY
ncbi:hypothetical protein LIPSTDRAFT_74386, partial [Lipomyces starkeyi NRRL Y-11557]